MSVEHMTLHDIYFFCPKETTCGIYIVYLVTVDVAYIIFVVCIRQVASSRENC